MPKENLLVDDEPNIVVPIQFLMEQQGYRVMIAERGEIVRLNPKYRNAKIIFLTAKGREVEIAKGLALGADAYITKHFSNAALVAKVKELLEKTCEEAGA